MKKPLVMTLLLLCSTFSFAQKAHEFGLKFSNLDSYGLVFKTGKKEALTRFSFLSVSSSNSTYENNGSEITTKNTGFSFSLGREFRIPLSEKFRLVLGPEAGYGFSKNKQNSDAFESKTKSSGWYVACIAGVNYTITENFLVSFELLPSANFSKSKTTAPGSDGTIRTTESSGRSVGFNTSSASITIAYRLFKDKTE